MGYRTVEIRWMPAGHAQWATFTAARKEAARLWADMVERHHRIRRLNWRWPSKARWQEWAKGRYPGLSAQVGQLDYKTCGALQVNEAYSSQTCPMCGRRRTCRRMYRCRCGIVAPRDVVGATNILSVGRHGSIQPGTPLPTAVCYAHPVNVSRSHPGSSSGHLGNSSL